MHGDGLMVVFILIGGKHAKCSTNGIPLIMHLVIPMLSDTY